MQGWKGQRSTERDSSTYFKYFQDSLKSFIGIGCLWKTLLLQITSTENRNPKNCGPRSQKKGLYHLKQITADPPVDSPRLPLCLRPYCPCFHTFLYVLQEILAITVFSYTFAASALLDRILRKVVIWSCS